MLLSAWSLSSFSHLSTFSYLEMIFSEHMILFILTSCAWQYRRLKELQRLRGNRQLWWRGNVLVRLYPRSVLLLFCPRPKIKIQVMPGLPGRWAYLNTSSRKLDADCRFWFEIEFVSSKSAQKIRFTDTWISDENNFEKVVVFIVTWSHISKKILWFPLSELSVFEEGVSEKVLLKQFWKSTFEKSLNPIQVCFRLFSHSNFLCHLYIASSNITLSLNHVLYTDLILSNPMPDAKNYFRLQYDTFQISFGPDFRKHGVLFVCPAQLRVVQTQAILFLKSMSERGGYDIKRLWIWFFNRFWVDLKIHHSISESFYVGQDRFRHWFQK